LYGGAGSKLKATMAVLRAMNPAVWQIDHPNEIQAPARGATSDFVLTAETGFSNLARRHTHFAFL
jgi:hypothetical protein